MITSRFNSTHNYNTRARNVQLGAVKKTVKGFKLCSSLHLCVSLREEGCGEWYLYKYTAYIYSYMYICI